MTPSEVSAAGPSQAGGPRAPAALLARLMQTALTARGLSTAHVEQVVSGLLTASLRGIDTHGVVLFPTYLAELDGGRSQAQPALRWQRAAPAVAVLDAGNALGLVAGFAAAAEAVQLATTHGVGVVAVRNSNHFGAASTFTLEMVRSAEVIGVCCTNSDALVAAHGGLTPLFGTNPLSFAVRGPDDELFCVDMATSQVAYSRIRQYQAAHRPLEPGWALGPDGADVGETAATPSEIVALQPLGGYKGQCLAMLIEILCALLVDLPCDHQLSHLFAPPFDTPRQVGHCFLALQLAALGDPAAFRTRLGHYFSWVRAQPAQQGSRVLVPGDLERAATAERTTAGIPLGPSEFAAFRDLATRHNDLEALSLLSSLGS